MNKELERHLNLYKAEDVFEERFSHLMRALQYTKNLEEKSLVYAEMIPFFFISRDLEKISELVSFMEKKGYCLDKAYYYRGLLEDEKGNLETAEVFYYKSIDEDKVYDKPYFALGFLYDRQGRIEKALEYYKKYSSLLEEKGLVDPTVLNDIASIYLDMGEIERAKSYLDRSLKQDSAYFRALYNMGLYYYKTGDSKKAVDFYEKAILSEPSFTNAYLNISAIYIEDKNYQEAIEILTRGINKTSCPDLLYNRACSYAQRGLYDYALDDLKRAYKYDKEIYKYAINDKDFEAMDLKGIFEGGQDDIY